ncbi:MAG: hypothetical protein PSV40_02945 [Polaromonas sp.]|uniref:hypothetical protein n=1 Tax=Polaromonas sp. TaxID=1869339 RepID=UPI0024874FC9|nr:hypothetical protein [Polaromonas sp.]MDI1268045.1 hypothetical protein [Polaromonas sp.]
MILTVEIDKIAPGIYEAHPTLGGVAAREPETYDRIDTAIRQEALGAEGFANFVEFIYGGMSTGTYEVQEASANASNLANRLVALLAQLHLFEESR